MQTASGSWSSSDWSSIGWGLLPQGSRTGGAASPHRPTGKPFTRPAPETSRASARRTKSGGSDSTPGADPATRPTLRRAFTQLPGYYTPKQPRCQPPSGHAPEACQAAKSRQIPRKIKRLKNRCLDAGREKGELFRPGRPWRPTVGRLSADPWARCGQPCRSLPVDTSVTRDGGRRAVPQRRRRPNSLGTRHKPPGPGPGAG